VLPVSQRLVLEVCNIFKNTFLQQSAFDAVDTYSSPRKQFLMLKVIMTFYQQCEHLVKKGITVAEIKETGSYKELLRIRFEYREDDLDRLAGLSEKMEESLKETSF
jgi:V/A-type H+-transporting ATPase subunit A